MWLILNEFQLFKAVILMYSEVYNNAEVKYMTTVSQRTEMW